MKDEDILARIQAVYDSILGRKGIVLTPETKLIRSGDISSFILAELVVAIEEEFDIELTYSKIRSMKTIRGLIKYIKAQE